MPFTIIQQDITQMQVDAIVNAANTELAMGGGVCGAIFRAAGPEKLQVACDKLSPIKTGQAAITPGFNLPARFVIHAAGPVYRRWDAKQSAQLLRSAYLESLKLALQNGCRSIAFPLISSGIYGYPKDEALQVASAAIKDFLEDHDMEVYLVIFDRATFAISRELLALSHIQRFDAIEEFTNYTDTKTGRCLKLKKSFEVPVFNEMMCELFQAMKELGGSGTIREIDDKTIEILGLPAEVQEIMHGNSSKTEVEYRLAWTRTYMKKVGILENSSRGVWSLTAKGREMEQIDPKEVVQKVREMTLLKTKGVDTINIEDDNLENDGVDTPDEIQSWREKLKNILLNLKPDAFERLTQGC